MTRLDFIRGYAKRSNIADDFADLGLLVIGESTYVALPCGCNAEVCPGWAMVSPGSVLDHLELYAPASLRNAYDESLAAAGGTGSSFAATVNAALDRADDLSGRQGTR